MSSRPVMSRRPGSGGVPEITEEAAAPPAAPPPAEASAAAVAHGEKKKAKVKWDMASMDAAMHKVHGKFQAAQDPKTPTYDHGTTLTGIPTGSWEIDPSKLSLSQKIGQGSFGTVHRGTYDGVDVAVKILNWNVDALSSEEADYYKQKFSREIAVMSSLSHPNITRFVGAWIGGREYQIPSTNLGSQGTYTLKQGTHLLLMEFVAGGSLRSLWVNARRAGRRRLGYTVVMQLMLDTARGLAYLHSKKICHRDLKPDNLLLDQNMKVKIADFGESRVTALQTTDMSENTGTYGYMAPEVLHGTATTGYDHKCDVFSFAICVWELYCCNVPFPELSANLNVRDLTEAIVQKGLRPPIPKCCPIFLRKLMKICWEADPNKRPEMRQIVGMIEAQPVSNCGIKVQEVCDSCCVFCDVVTGGS